MKRRHSHHELPWLPPAEVVSVPGRGEFFVRRFVHPNPSAPTLLLLHGWTGTGDINFFSAYEQLAEKYSFVVIDHRGHGRGLRPAEKFALEDCADDAAAIIRELGLNTVTPVGYSMGGPISMLLWKRHGALVHSIVLCATALEWNGTKAERRRWKTSRFFSPLIRILSTPRLIERVVHRAIPRNSTMHRHVSWIVSEIRRNDSWVMREAGRALSTYSAVEWAGQVDVPVACVVTTSDVLVPPRKQHQLASATSAHVVPLDGDHLAMWGVPERYATALRMAVDWTTSTSTR